LDQRRRRRSALRILICVGMLVPFAACSLLTLKSPERPLSARDLNTRILTRELSARFIASVARCAQQISAAEDDPAVLDNTLRWEIAAVAESRRAATRMAPMMTLLDTWALAEQMKAFTAPGAAGGALFGTHQQAVREVSDGYADDAEGLARRLIAPGEFADYQKFVDQYTREHPLEDLTFTRASVVELWSRTQAANTRLIDSLGTIPEAMADAADRMQIYGDTVPAEITRKMQLALREYGSKSDVQASLQRLDERLERLTEVAQTTPALVHGAEAQVRQSVREVLQGLEASQRAATEALHTERAALFTDLQSEREALVAAVDVQRRAAAADASRVAGEVVKSSGEQVRALARDVLSLLIVLAVVMLGLPFAAGYLVGRARHGRAP
jgi:hypothetical protein